MKATLSGVLFHQGQHEPRIFEQMLPATHIQCFVRYDESYFVFLGDDVTTLPERNEMFKEHVAEPLKPL